MNDQTDWVELRRHWRPRWLSSIQEFSDIDTQRQKWLNPNNTNPHFSFVEYMNCYFDDIGLRDHDFGYDGWISHGLATREEVNAVRPFHAVADAYDAPTGNDYDTHAVLADPRWHTVVASAQVAQRALARILTDPEELRLLLEP